MAAAHDVMKRNVPSRKGALLGEQIARLTPPVRGMCRTCAFRLGTYPNRCLQTVTAAVDCVIRGGIFHCHENFDDNGEEIPCSGFLSAMKKRSWGSNLEIPS